MPLLRPDSSQTEASSKSRGLRRRISNLLSRSRSSSPSVSRPQAALEPHLAPSTSTECQTDVSPDTLSLTEPINTRPDSHCQEHRTGRRTYDGHENGPVHVPSQGTSRAQDLAAKHHELETATETPDLPETAYQKALSSFSAEQQGRLAGQDTIHKLFRQLHASDSAHSGHSPLRKGLKAVKPYLERLSLTIDVISPFASMEPSVGTALGVVKGVTSVAISLCGRFGDVTKNIATFLQHIPAIDRCASVVTKDGASLPEIHDALVNVYTDLLQFYLKTMTLFEESHFVLAVALDALRHQVVDILSSFQKHAEQLSRLLEAESFASIQEIKLEQVEMLSMFQAEYLIQSMQETAESDPQQTVRDTLGHGQEYEWSSRDKLERRSDEACQWLATHESFSYWILDSHDTHLLALFGDMGCGKTMTTAFVADTLAQPGRPLCAYYCKDDHEAADLGNIYRSILVQFLSQSPQLRLRFWAWYRQESARGAGDPTRRKEKLRALLFEIISSFRQPVFFVLDALDECPDHPRKQLVSLFRELFEVRARLKVFVSSRYDADLETELPPGAVRLELRPSLARDRAIAEYLVAETHLPDELRPRVVDELATRAAGSAIWLRIAVEYIARSRVRNHKGLEMALNALPASHGLANLYGKLFSKVCHGVAQLEVLLCRALEILAAARRPLTPEELSHAVFTIGVTPEEEVSTLAELDELANSVDLFNLVRPFTTTVKGSDGSSPPQLRLVHQSLKEFILTAPPSEWCSVDAMAKRRKGARAAQLNARLLQICIRYLLLDECETNSLFPSAGRDATGAELLRIGRLFEDVTETADALTPTSTTGMPAGDFDPSELGFGCFFAYAAAHWTGHFVDVSPDRRPGTQQLLDLCRKGSRRLENWAEQWRRPRCTYIPQRDLPYATPYLDPLLGAAHFGPAASVTDLLALELDGSVLHEGSTWTAARSMLTQLEQQRDLAAIKRLICEESALQKVFCTLKLLYTLVREWRCSGDDGAAAAAAAVHDADWQDIFGFLVRRLRPDLLTCGNDLLRAASRAGCLPLLNPLLAACAADPELRAAVLTPPPAPSPPAPPPEALPSSTTTTSTTTSTITTRHQTPHNSTHHQSIGEAALAGQTATIHFLCTHPLIIQARHLYHTTPGHGGGSTVFHAAMRGGHPRADVLRALIRYWRAGVNVRDGPGETPLALMLFSRVASTADDDEGTKALVRLLLREGGADATGRGDPGQWCVPLCNAVRGGHVALLRVLVVEGGADVWRAVRVEEGTGRPRLRAEVEAWEDEGRRRAALRVLCSLIPFVGAVEYLG